MKKIILALLLAGCSATLVNAQEIPDRKTEESKPIVKEKIVDKKESANLNLTNDQKEKLKSMNQDLHKQMEDLRKQDNISVKEYRERMETLRKDRQTQFESILTPEQKDQLQKDRDARKAKDKAFGAKKQEKMKEELNLTDDQVAKMSENRKAMSEKMKAIQDNKSLSEDQKKQETRELMKKQREDMKSILTEEQLQKLKENHKQHSKKRKVV